jgi:hypothetical protein
MLAYVGPRANEKYARNIREDPWHMVPIDEVVSSARETALKLPVLP